MSTRWSTATKFWVLTAGTILTAFAVYRLRDLVPLVGLALILAYILSPLVDRIQRYSPIGRTAATTLVYLGLLALLLTAPAVFAPSILEEARAIDRGLIQDVINNLITRVQAYRQDSEVYVLGFPFNLSPAYDQLLASLRSLSGSVASQSIGFLLTFASGFASTLLGLFLMLVLSFYLVKDSYVIVSYLENLVPSPYRAEVITLVDEINQVWRDFFRGQILLVAVVGFVTWLGLFILGVPNALLLGIVAGLLELIPNLGPTLAAIPAVLIAYFQGSTHLAISSGWFALIVLLLYVVIQQVENTILVPRIIGGSVHLHPVVVLIGILAGASLAGILGIFLAAPVLASIRVIGSYTYDKLLESPPTQAVKIQEAAVGVKIEEEEAADDQEVKVLTAEQSREGSVSTEESEENADQSSQVTSSHDTANQRSD